MEIEASPTSEFGGAISDLRSVRSVIGRHEERIADPRIRGPVDDLLFTFEREVLRALALASHTVNSRGREVIGFRLRTR